MTQDQIIECIREMMNVSGIESPAEIAFGIIQRASELESHGDSHLEEIALRAHLKHIAEAGEEEIAVLEGRKGNTYITPGA